MSAETVWQNWSGSQRHRARVLSPRSVAEVTSLVAECARGGGRVRCVGSGHSFVPFWIDDVILSLDHLRGVLAADPERGQATVAAGTKLHELGPALWEAGLSLPQQGDIDRQSLAGALSTGTHGTGRGLPSLSAFARAITLVTAGGETITVSREQEGDRFRAAQVAMGTLGVVVAVTLDLLPAYHLHERTWECPVAECQARLAELIEGNRHFEFFWTPRTDRCDMKTLNPASADTLASIDARASTEPATLAEGERVGPAYRIFPSERDIRFNEMEYSVPFAAGWACFEELREMMLARFPKLPWPIEFRTLAADDTLIGTASGRESVTLSIHQGAERDYRPLFDAAEAICRNHRGRPHWGKLHSLKAPDLADLYPGFDRFREIRRDMDPDGVFLNDYLAALLR